MALTAVNAEAVALTQPPGTPGVGDVHPVDVMSRSATVVRAWNVDVDFLPVFFNTMLKLPEAFVRALKPAVLPLTSRLTLAPETALPACVTFPVNFTSRFPALHAQRARFAAVSTRDRDSRRLSESAHCLAARYDWDTRRLLLRMVGRDAEFRRRASVDKPLQKALELARGAKSEHDLLRRAMAQAPLADTDTSGDDAGGGR